MKILVLGGTRFLGRHVVEALLARNHEVTLFNRGRSGPGLFPQVETLHGDRDAGADGLAALAGRRWDAAIDCCGYLPRVVRAGCALLAPAVERYLFVSSISVYASLAPPGPDEDAPLAALPDPATEDVGEHYGALKAACEREVQAAFGDRALLVRPGLIVGPWDPTGRFSWWLRRLAAPGPVLAPGDPAAPVQFIDARDLARWMVRALTRGAAGAFNATGPAQPLSMGALLAAIRQQLAPAVTAPLVWCDEDFLLGAGVRPWTQLPLWVPRSEAGVHQVSIERALDAGLLLRPLADTVADTWAWLVATGAQDRVASNAGIGLDPAEELRLIAAWQARAGAAGGAAADRPSGG